MDVQAHAVTGAMGETVGPPGVGNDRTSCCIDLGGTCSGDHGINACLLGRKNDVVVVPLFSAHWPDAEGTGHVAAVPMDHCPYVDDHQVATFNRAIAGRMMWNSSVGARGNDRVKTQVISTAGANRRIECTGKVTFGWLLGKQRPHDSQRGVDDLGSGTNASNLAIIFLRPKLIDKSNSGHDRLLRKPFLANPALLCPTHVFGLEPYQLGATQELLDFVTQCGSGDHDFCRTRCRRQLDRRPICVPRISEQRDVRVVDNDGRVRSGEACKPTNICR